MAHTPQSDVAARLADSERRKGDLLQSINTFGWQQIEGVVVAKRRGRELEGRNTRLEAEIGRLHGELERVQGEVDQVRIHCDHAGEEMCKELALRLGEQVARLRLERDLIGVEEENMELREGRVHGEQARQAVGEIKKELEDKQGAFEDQKLAWEAQNCEEQARLSDMSAELEARRALFEQERANAFQEAEATKQAQAKLQEDHQALEAKEKKGDEEARKKTKEMEERERLLRVREKDLEQGWAVVAAQEEARQHVEKRQRDQQRVIDANAQAQLDVGRPQHEHDQHQQTTQEQLEAILERSREDLATLVLMEQSTGSSNEGAARSVSDRNAAARSHYTTSDLEHQRAQLDKRERDVKRDEDRIKRNEDGVKVLRKQVDERERDVGRREERVERKEKALKRGWDQLDELETTLRGNFNQIQAKAQAFEQRAKAWTEKQRLRQRQKRAKYGEADDESDEDVEQIDFTDGDPFTEFQGRK